MNFLEVKQVLNKMIHTTMIIQRNLTIATLNKGFLIDKNTK